MLLEDALCLRHLRDADDGDVPLEDSCLFRGDLGDRVSELVRVVQRYAGHPAQRRFEHVGAVQPPAKPGLDDGDVHLGFGEMVERHGGDDLEEGRFGVGHPLDVR